MSLTLDAHKKTMKQQRAKWPGALKPVRALGLGPQPLGPPQSPKNRKHVVRRNGLGFRV